MADITIRWAGASDATGGSSYQIERTLDFETWTELAGAQAATAPYAAVLSLLNGDLTYGDNAITLKNASAFATSGYAWIDDALVQWTGKATDVLTGVTWHSGYGVYADGTAALVAHESYVDSGVTITNYAVVYRLVHVDANGNRSAPLYLWYYAPPVPASSQHCVVVVNIGADLGVAPQVGVTVRAYLDSDREFGQIAGQHLDANSVIANSATTNALGLAFFHCWKDSARAAIGSGDSPYIFTLKPGTGQLMVSVHAIPDDRSWVLLPQVATSTGALYPQL
jgi:hypothetical protein